MLRLRRNLRFEVHKVPRLPRNLHFKVHKVLRLPQNLHFEVHKALHLPRNLHFKVHQVLYLLRNLHFEVPKVLRLPQNLHFKVHKVLHLPRKLHFEVHQELRLPRNLHHQALCLPRNLHFKVHKALRLPRNLHFKVHQALYQPRNLHFEVHQVLRLPQNLHFEVHKVLHLLRNLHIEGHRVLCLPQNLQTSHMPKSHDSLHLSRNLSSSRMTTMSKVLRAPRKVDFGAPKHEASLAPPRKVTTMCKNACGTTTRAQSLEAPAAATQTLRACAVEMHFDDFEKHECAVNSSELAGHGRVLQRSKHQLLFCCSKNPSVCPHCLVNKPQAVFLHFFRFLSEKFLRFGTAQDESSGSVRRKRKIKKGTQRTFS